MSASERPKNEAETGPEEERDQLPHGKPADGIHEVPLFLRNKSDGHKGDAQDEKDEMGE